MPRDTARADINLASIPADSNAGGLIFAIATVIIFTVGIPAIRSVFPILIVAGCCVAAILRLTRR